MSLLISVLIILGIALALKGIVLVSSAKARNMTKFIIKDEKACMIWGRILLGAGIVLFLIGINI